MKYSLCFSIILLWLSLGLNAQENTHYNIANKYLNVLEFEERLILYGDWGGVLLSDDDGQSWEQNYSGLHSRINDIITFKEILICSTDEGQIMISEDSGNSWSINKIRDKRIVNLATDGELIYANILQDSILVSSDIGASWSAVDFNPGLFLKSKYTHLYTYDNFVFAKLNSNELLYSSDLEKWDRSNLPSFLKGLNPNYVLHRMNQTIFVGDGFNVAEMVGQNEWKEYQTDFPHHKIIDLDDRLILFRSEPSNFQISYGIFDKSEDSIVSNGVIEDFRLSRDNFNIIGTSKSGNKIILSCNGKTIILFDTETYRSETISSYPSSLTESIALSFYHDSLNWSFLTSNYHFYKTTNGGTTFEIGKDFLIDSVSSSEFFIPNINGFYSYNKNDLLLTVSNTRYSTVRSSDGGMTFQKSNELENYGGAGGLVKVGDEMVFTRILNAGKTFAFYKHNESYNVDSLSQIDSVEISYYFDGNSFWAYGNEIKHDNKISVFILESKDTCKTWETKFEKDYIGYRSVRLNTFKKTRKGEFLIFIYTREEAFQTGKTTLIHLKDWESKPKTILDEERKYFTFGVNQSSIEDQYCLMMELDPFQKYTYVKFNTDNGIRIKEVEPSKHGSIKSIYTSDNDYLLYGGRNDHMWRPIKEESLSNMSESTIESFEIIKNLFPNPAENTLTVEYQNSGETQIELLNIKGNVVFHTKTIESTLNINISDLPSGSYILRVIQSGKADYQKVVVE